MKIINNLTMLLAEKLSELEVNINLWKANIYRTYDRAIGHGLRHDVDFSKTIVTCSGRLSSETVRKCLIANIPVISSRGATTTLAISIGKQAGLTITGFVRSQKMNIYTGAERIRNE